MGIDENIRRPAASDGSRPWSRATATDGDEPAVAMSKFENVRRLTASDGGPSCRQAKMRATDGDEPAVAKELTDGHVPPDVLMVSNENGYCLVTASVYSP